MNSTDSLSKWPRTTDMSVSTLNLKSQSASPLYFFCLYFLTYLCLLGLNGLESGPAISSCSSSFVTVLSPISDIPGKQSEAFIKNIL